MHLGSAPAKQQGHLQVQTADEIAELIGDASVDNFQKCRKVGGKFWQLLFMRQQMLDKLRETGQGVPPGIAMTGNEGLQNTEIIYLAAGSTVFDPSRIGRHIAESFYCRRETGVFPVPD